MVVRLSDDVIDISADVLDALIASSKKHTGDISAKTVKEVLSILSDVAARYSDNVQIDDQAIYTYLCVQLARRNDQFSL